MKTALLLASLGAVAVGAQAILTAQTNSGPDSAKQAAPDLIGVVTTETFATHTADSRNLTEQDETQYMLRTLNGRN